MLQILCKNECDVFLWDDIGGSTVKAVLAKSAADIPFACLIGV